MVCGPRIQPWHDHQLNYFCKALLSASLDLHISALCPTLQPTPHSHPLDFLMDIPNLGTRANAVTYDNVLENCVMIEFVLRAVWEDFKNVSILLLCISVGRRGNWQWSAWPLVTHNKEFLGLCNSSRGLRLLRIRHSFNRTKGRY